MHVSDSSSVHHQEFFTVRTAMVYVIQVCWLLASRIRTDFHPDPSRKLCVQWKTPDDGHRKYLKHVEFCSKNKFEKLVHLICFIIRIKPVLSTECLCRIAFKPFCAISTYINPHFNYRKLWHADLTHSFTNFSFVVWQLDTTSSPTEASRCCKHNKPDKKRQSQDIRINQEVMNNMFCIVGIGFSTRQLKYL